MVNFTCFPVLALSWMIISLKRTFFNISFIFDRLSLRILCLKSNRSCWLTLARSDLHTFFWSISPFVCSAHSVWWNAFWWILFFLRGIPVVSHTIAIGLCPLMQISCKYYIAFWIHVSHSCTLWVPIFITWLVFVARRYNARSDCSDWPIVGHYSPLLYGCLTRTGNYRIHKFDWLKSILKAV